MYLHIGQETVVPEKDLIGIFDIENTTVSGTTRDFLARAEKEKRVVTVGEELPKSFIVCRDTDKNETVYVSQISCATLRKRAAAGTFIEEKGAES